MNWGKCSPPSQVTSEQEIDRELGSKHLLLIRDWGCGRRLFMGSTLSGAFKRCPRKSKVKTYVGPLSSGL